MTDAEPGPGRLDATPPRAASTARAKRRGRGRRRHTVAKVLLATVVAMALVTGLSVVYLYRELSGNLNVVEVGDRLQDRPDVVDVAGSREPLNVLVMGSDTREGEGNDIDGESGAAASDTTILFHFSADRERAYGVSIPRDSMVDRPACDRGEIPAEDYQMWNEAFSIGGPACTIQQFEQLTDLRIDHYVVLDFNGFRDMVDAVDGVQVCIPETIDDREHGIYLEEGTREIRGKEALNYVRQRYAVGNGSDIGRMKRQQAFIASMAAKVLSADTLSRPDRLISFASAATRSLTVDPGLGNIGRLAGLAQEFQGIGLDKIKFMTVPWQVDPQDSNRIVWTDQADVLWRKMRNDEPLSRTLTGTAISAADVPGGPAGPGSGAGDGGDGAGGGGTPSSPSASPQQQAAAEQARQEALDAGLCV